MNDESFDIFGEIKTWFAQWPDGIIAVDKDLRVLIISPKGTEILGWSNEDISGTHIHDAICAHSREHEHTKSECVFNDLFTSIESCESHSGVWLCSDGFNLSVDFRIIPIKNAAKTKAVIMFYSNRSHDHNQAEMRKFAEYTDKNPTPLVEFDNNGQMLYGNPAMQDALLEFGFSDEGLPNFLPPDIADICYESASESKSVTHVEYQVGDFWYNWHFHPIETENEITVLGYGFDVTRQKVAEEEARITRAEARRDFYAKMIHDLRTPLNAIVGYSDVLLWRSKKDLNDRDQKALRTIKVAGMQLNEMISDTLDISKIEAGKMEVEPESFQPQTLLDDFHEQMDYLAEAKGLSYVALCETDIILFTDQRKVRQILINLISNAIKYTKQGSVIVSIKGPSKPAFNERTTTDVISLSVSDTGIGIPDEQIDSLFEAYEQVRESKNKGIQGTGIGLALVSELTYILGGEIKVESVYGEGSNFTVELPITISEN